MHRGIELKKISVMHSQNEMSSLQEVCTVNVLWEHSIKSWKSLNGRTLKAEKIV